jgi:uncharacterized protein YdeI (YjbR/CyaY-like superfamily)
MKPKPQFFATPAAWREWLEQHHSDAQQLWVGFYKCGSGRPSITWPESVDGALCFGWIDGVRRSIDAASYMIRFTPRKARSHWSAVNIRRVGELSKLGLMHPAGVSAFAKRESSRSSTYSYEQRKNAKLSSTFEREFRANHEAWNFFQLQPPWYQRTAAFWVISAKKEGTRRKRFDTLMSDSARQRSIAPLRRAITK